MLRNSSRPPRQRKISSKLNTIRRIKSRKPEHFKKVRKLP
jgi:hypothetical protein